MPKTCVVAVLAGSGTSAREAGARASRGSAGARGGAGPRRGARLGAQRTGAAPPRSGGMRLGAQKLNTKLEDNFEF